jgi:hypothetical protein
MVAFDAGIIKGKWIVWLFCILFCFCYLHFSSKLGFRSLTPTKNHSTWLLLALLRASGGLFWDLVLFLPCHHALCNIDIHSVIIVRWNKWNI